MTLRRLRIGTRLALVFGLVIAVFLVMAAAARYSIGSLNAEIGHIIGQRYASTVLAHRLQGEIGDAAFKLIFTDHRFAGTPMILETPKHDAEGNELDPVNLGRVREFAARVARL